MILMDFEHCCVHVLIGLLAPGPAIAWQPGRTLLAAGLGGVPGGRKGQDSQVSYWTLRAFEIDQP